ncbi:integrase [Streptomyces misionensis]|uniref:integrase n=1 Tax=Streptomyces misionensis TaxID=67331 RepID=UPI0036B38980
MPYIETRGRSIRVKWWNGEYILDEDGKPTKKKKYESASGPEAGIPFKDEDEAYKYGLDREYEVRHGKHIPRASRQTPMDEYAWTWYEAADLRPRSLVTYRSMIRTVIAPDWSGRPVGDITPIEYERWERSVKKRYSDNYASQLCSLFRTMMIDAVTKYKLRTDSPVVTQKRRGRYVKRKVRREKKHLPIEPIHQLAVNAHTLWGYQGWVYVWTVAFTGMRPPGEMFGFQRGFASPNWPASDPDKERREEAQSRYKDLHALRVQYQVYRVDGQATLASPKYESQRTLVIPPFLHRMHETVLAAHDSPFVFLSMAGLPLLGTHFNRVYWHPMRDGADERAGRFGRPKIPAVPEMAGQDIYRLRHWHRALLDEPGADIAKVAKEARMGHELPGMEGAYSEVTLAMEERISEYLQGVWEKQVVATGLWTPSFPTSLPSASPNGASALFSDLPVLDA